MTTLSESNIFGVVVLEERVFLRSKRNDAGYEEFYIRYCWMKSNSRLTLREARFADGVASIPPGLVPNLANIRRPVSKLVEALRLYVCNSIGPVPFRASTWGESSVVRHPVLLEFSCRGCSTALLLASRAKAGCQKYRKTHGRENGNGPFRAANRGYAALL